LLRFLSCPATKKSSNAAFPAFIPSNVLGNVPNDEQAEWTAKRAKGEVETEDEDYHPSVAGFVADMNNERAIPALVGAAPYAGDATGALLRFGDKAVGPLLEQLKSRNALLRSSALELAIGMEGQDERVSPARNQRNPSVRTR
jgi:hypothetical protein